MHVKPGTQIRLHELAWERSFNDLVYMAVALIARSVTASSLWGTPRNQRGTPAWGPRKKDSLPSKLRAHCVLPLLAPSCEDWFSSWDLVGWRTRMQTWVSAKTHWTQRENMSTDFKSSPWSIVENVILAISLGCTRLIPFSLSMPCGTNGAGLLECALV